MCGFNRHSAATCLLPPLLATRGLPMSLPTLTQTQGTAIVVSNFHEMYQLRNTHPNLQRHIFVFNISLLARHGLGLGWQYAVLSRRCTAALWRHQTRGHALSFALESLVMSRVWMQRLSRATHPSSIVPRVFWTRTPSKWCFSRVTCGCATARGTLGGSWRATRSSSAPRVCEAGHAHLLHLPRLPCSRLPVPIRHHHYCCHPPQIPARAWRNGLDRPSSAVSDT